ncbi:MAG: O-antigen ligase family protein [Clostridia bacterium]|nr:O-antigen ligase family protein [Clostridia bacterium]
MTEIKNKLNDKAHIFLAVLMLIQPVMDIISFWFQRWALPDSITLLLRMGMLALTLLFAFTVSERKWIYFTVCGVIGLLYLGHLYAIWEAGIQSIVTDMSNYVRVVQMPLCTVAIISCLRRNKKAFEGLQWGMTIALWIILSVMIISVITGTDPGMYRNGTNFYNTGVLGWFNNTNSQSSNLSVLLPVACITLLNAKKRRPMALIVTLVLGLLAMFFACTRLAYLGIAAVTVGIGVMILILRRKDWRYSIIFLALAVVFIALIDYSPMTAHLNIYNDEQSDRQADLAKKIQDLQEVNSLINKQHSAEDSQSSALTEEERRELISQLAPVYKYYISDFVQIFGLSETMEMYNYTTDVKTLSALRAKKITYAEQTLERLPVSAQIFGIEYSRFTVSTDRYGQPLLNSIGQKTVETYDVENDFHGILYLYGWAGLALYIAFLGYFAVLIIWALIKSIKKYFTLDAVSLGIGLLLCLAHSYFTAGVLRRPNASIFLSAVLAGVYYLVVVKKYDTKPEIDPVTNKEIPKITEIFGKEE